MDPVFRGIAHEVLLGSAGGGVAFDGVAASSYKVVLAGEFYDESIVVFLVEWFGVETGCEDWFKDERGLFVVFFLRITIATGKMYQDLLERGVVEAGIVR